MSSAQTVNNRLTLIGAASCYGARDTRCDMGPEIIKASNLVSRLQNSGITATWHGVLRPAPNQPDLDAIVDLCDQVEQVVNDCITDKTRFTVIGGDHSCAVGTWNGMSNALKDAPAGLIWIDAHMDSHTPSTSPTGAYHGMPLACLLGQGENALCDIGCPGRSLAPDNVCLIGVRSFEAEEHELLDRLGVRIFFADEVRQRGLDAVMQDAASLVGNTAGFGVSIDLDAIDPVDAPGVGSPTQDGLQAEELLRSLPRLKQMPNYLGAEITEFNPFRDVNDKTADLVVDLVLALA